MKHKYILFLIILLLPAIAYSQFSLRRPTTVLQPADTTDLRYYSKKKGWGAAGQIVSLNLGVWFFDRYIMKEDFAYISSQTIKDNIKGGFYWDNDQIGTNMFLHPYHGSLYYNSARSRGFNYWTSGAFALGGSAMWELFMENEHPSVNDLIATPVGGLALGEMFYRTSDLALDDRTKGGERFKHEAIAFIISPARGLTRILNGDAWKVRHTSGRQFGVPLISVEASIGMRVLELKDEIFDKGAGVATTLSMEYGDRFDHVNAKPFDYFSIRTNLNFQKSQPVLGQINIIGRLWATDLLDSDKDYFGININQHFDYYDSDTISSVSNKIPYKIAAPASFGVGLVHKNKRFINWNFSSFFHLNGILLGAALSDHYRIENRNYNIGSGFGSKGGLGISYKDKASISAFFEYYRLFSWKGYEDNADWQTIDHNEINVQGEHSNAALTTTSLKTEFKLRNQLYLTGIATLFKRSTHYRYYSDVYSLTSEGRLMLTYKF